MKEVKGNLISLAKEGQFDVIIHGANCFHTMGAGIAKSIKKEFPKAFEADKETNFGDRNKLGTISLATFQINEEADFLTVINAYTQFGIRQHGYSSPIDYTAVDNCFYEIQKQFGYKHLRFGIPKIGAGLAGGDWEVISRIIENYLGQEDLTLVVLE